MIPQLLIIKIKPIKVNKLGATHKGTNSTTHDQNGLNLLSNQE